MDSTRDLTTVRSDHVGSLPCPRWLRAEQLLFEDGKIDADQLERSHERAVSSVLERQSEIGLPIFTDGELSRRGFQESFGGAVAGFDAAPDRYANTSHYPSEPTDDVGRSAPAAQRIESGLDGYGPAISRRRPTRERLRLVRNVILEEYRRSSSLTSKPVKVTLVGPDRIAQRFAYEASGPAYRGLDDFVDHVVMLELEIIAEVVAAGCRYVQIDEPGYTAYVDEPSLAKMRARGENPARNFARGIAADNALRAGFPDVTFAIHICRGGGGGRGGPGFHRAGTYDAIAEQLYGDLTYDRFLLEYDSDAAGGFDSLRYLQNGKVAVLGLVSNHGDVESTDYLKRRLDQAARFLPLDRLAICPRCGFRSADDEETAWAKLATVQLIADDVWR